MKILHTHTHTQAIIFLQDAHLKVIPMSVWITFADNSKNSKYKISGFNK